MVDPLTDIARRMTDLVEAARELPDTNFMVLGVRIPGRELERMVADVFGAVDDAPAVLAERLAGNMANPIAPARLPASLRPIVEGVAIDPVDRSLAMHWGIDPIRLQLAAFDRNGEMRRGKGRATCRPVFEADRLARIDLSFQLERRVSWRGGRLSWMGGAIPAAIAAGTVGRRMDEIIGHSWPGWGDLVVTRARNRGSVLIIDTEPTQAERRLAA